ncbi:MAG: hypothetical protein ABI947_14645 [Chloroflexota bacterium]
MAKGLKVGDSVSVIKTVRFKPSSETFNNGLTSVKPGEIGTVLRTAAGRSVVVEFQGKEAILSSQRLESRTVPKKGRRGRPRTIRPEESNETTPTTDSGKRTESKVAAETALFNYRDARFVTTIANKLLMSGDTKFESPSVVVEIRLAELPDEVQRQIKSLMEAKLALGPQNGSTGRKPGRPRKNGGTPTGSGQRGRKPKAAN